MSLKRGGPPYENSLAKFPGDEISQAKSTKSPTKFRWFRGRNFVSVLKSTKSTKFRRFTVGRMPFGTKFRYTKSTKSTKFRCFRKRNAMGRRFSYTNGNSVGRNSGRTKFPRGPFSDGRRNFVYSTNAFQRNAVGPISSSETNFRWFY